MINDNLKRKAKKMGRPRTVANSLRSAPRLVHFCPHEAMLIDDVVRDSGKSFSSWAREALLEAAGSAK